MMSCDDFNELVERAQVADLDDEEWDRFVDHESGCSIHGPVAAHRQPSDEALLRNCLALLDREIQGQRPPVWRRFLPRLNPETFVAIAALLPLLLGGAVALVLRPAPVSQPSLSPQFPPTEPPVVEPQPM